MKGSELIEVQSGVASRHTLHALGTAILDPTFAAEIENLRTLLPEDMSAEDRATNCEATASYILASLRDAEPMNPVLEETKSNGLKLSRAFIQNCSPLSKWRWRSHIYLKREDGRIVWGLCSQRLGKILMNVERFWGCHGRLVEGGVPWVK